MAEGHDLEGVRTELRRLGYLDHGFERFLLQDALRPRHRQGALLRLTAKVAALLGLALAPAIALLLAAVNGNLGSNPMDALVLAAHLLPPVVLGGGLAFLALAGGMVLAVRIYHVRRIETLSLAVAVSVGAAGLAFAGRAVWELVGSGHAWLVALFFVATPLLLYGMVKLVYHGLVAFSLLLTRDVRLGHLTLGRWLALAVVVAGAILAVPAVVSARRHADAPPPFLPTGHGERVLLVGVDGVLPEELDYLLARGVLPGASELLANGGSMLRYPRRPEPPASFWTSIATGVAGPGHGVVALDSFRPLGVESPLARSGPLRLYWDAVLPLGLAEYRPLLANRRRAFAFWELASRGGASALAVNWWATFPAEPLPGLVVAHGAYQLLQDGAEGAMAPQQQRAAVVSLARAARRESSPLAAALPAGDPKSVDALALAPDRFYRAVALRGQAQSRAVALYLPAIDIAAAHLAESSLPFADLVREELAATDALLGQVQGGFGTVALVFDPGRRRAGGEGRVLLWRQAGSCGATGDITATQVASALLRALGLPQSRELPPPPSACRFAPPPLTVATYGQPERAVSLGREGGEYLKSLRSLGYL
jgi:hypothetical protein